MSTRSSKTDLLQNIFKKSVVLLVKMQSAVGYFDHTEMFKLFDTMIKPILCYGAEIWGLT